MNYLRLAVTKTNLRLIAADASTAGSAGYDCVQFTFDASWDGFARTAIFWRGTQVCHVPLGTEESCFLPQELTQKAGIIHIGVMGVNADGVILTTATPVAHMVGDGAYRGARIPPEPTPSLYEEILQQIAAIQTRAGAQGPQGEKGETGAQGPQGEKGDPYTLTDADKEAIVAAVALESVAKNQGVENAGKILIVGADGILTLTDMPEGASGDVVGTLNGDNNILLIGDLADGVYTLMYDDGNGNYTGAGELNVGNIPEEEPIINLLDSALDPSLSSVYNSKGCKENVRWSHSNAKEVSCSDNILTGLLPIGANGDIFWTNGLDCNNYAKYFGQVCFYDDAGSLTHSARTDIQYVAATLTGENGETGFVFVPSLLPASSSYFRVSLGLNGVGNPIMTRNQAITV